MEVFYEFLKRGSPGVSVMEQFRNRDAGESCGNKDLVGMSGPHYSEVV